MNIVRANEDGVYEGVHHSAGDIFSYSGLPDDRLEVLDDVGEVVLPRTPGLAKHPSSTLYGRSARSR
jgi:hypothetical protein